MSSAVPEKTDPQSYQDKFDFTLSLGSNLGEHSPYNPDLTLYLVPFSLFFLHGRSSWKDGRLPGPRTSPKSYLISEIDAIQDTGYRIQDTLLSHS